MARRFYVYILASRSKVLYVGVTGNLARRMEQHRAGVGSRFVRKYRVVRLVWCEEHRSPYGAITREKQIKAWRRSKKRELIEEMNSEWRDLALYDWPVM